jgi:hypothetical protein
MMRATKAKIAAVFWLAFASVSTAHAQTLTWSPIDCSKSDIALDGITRCEQTNSRSGPDGQGDYYFQIARVSTSEQRIYIYVHKPRAALRTGGIGMMTPEQREQWLTRPSQDAIKPGIVFSETLKTPAGYAKTYALPNGWQCFSFVKNAPPMGESRGVAYALYGYSCQKTPQTPTEAAINAFIEKVSVRR